MWYMVCVLVLDGYRIWTSQNPSFNDVQRDHINNHWTYEDSGSMIRLAGARLQSKFDAGKTVHSGSV